MDYAKCLYDRQDDDIKAQYPLAQPLAKQSALELNFSDGNRIVGIPHGADKIRSYHPTALLSTRPHSYQTPASRLTRRLQRVRRLRC